MSSDFCRSPKDPDSQGPPLGFPFTLCYLQFLAVFFYLGLEHTAPPFPERPDLGERKLYYLPSSLLPSLPSQEVEDEGQGQGELACPLLNSEYPW